MTTMDRFRLHVVRLCACNDGDLGDAEGAGAPDTDGFRAAELGRGA
jgi:hypothetical protein